MDRLARTLRSYGPDGHGAAGSRAFPPQEAKPASGEAPRVGSVEPVTPGRPRRAAPGEEGLEPLVLDLDRVLARPDMLAECALAYIRSHPLRIFQLLTWLVRGRSILERELASRVPAETLTLPLNAEVEAFATGEKAKGRKVYLAAPAGDRSDLVARSVAHRCGFFDGILGASGGAPVLAFAGGAPGDLPAGSGRSASRAPDSAVPRAPLRPGALLECARPHQWAKNILVFVPAVLSGEITDLDSFLSVLLAFIALCVVASSTYLLNDIWDVADDRRHWTKRRRPIASGRLPLTRALVAAPVGLLVGMLLAAAVGPMVALALAAYVVLTISYSVSLKRVPILDVTVLAGLFTLRLIIGIAAAGVFASPWLLVFSMFLFSSLCFAKRYVELERSCQRGEAALAHRGYEKADGPLLLVFGPATAIAAIVVLVLYVIFDAFRQTFYGNTVWLWAFPIVLFLWTSRVWLVAVRGALDDDPVAFALKDRPSLVFGALMLAAFLLAWSGAFA